MGCGCVFHTFSCFGCLSFAESGRSRCEECRVEVTNSCKGQIRVICQCALNVVEVVYDYYCSKYYTFDLCNFLDEEDSEIWYSLNFYRPSAKQKRYGTMFPYS